MAKHIKMNQSDTHKKQSTLWQRVNHRFVLVLIILVFAAYSVYIATHLLRDIVPDEPYHLALSQGFAGTWGIPEDVPLASSAGHAVRRNPFLAYWIFGRSLDFLNLVLPNPSPWQQLVALRLVNVAFSIGTVVFTYLFSRQLIRHKWWSLLPVFVLTNTLMFVLLSGGVSYDNPANFLSIAGIYFLLRVLQKEDFLFNSLGWLIFISLGTLTKETILPLALAMAVVWIIFMIKNRVDIKPRVFRNVWSISLLILLALAAAANFALYGLNLIQHGSLTPSCRDYYSDEFCENTAFALRREELALDEEPTLLQAFRQGYPEPVRYAFDTWIRAMLMKIFGIMGGAKAYYPIGIAYYHILLYWYLALAIRYFKKGSFTLFSLAGIFGFYALTLFIKNYDIELAYGFIQVALQGRYIFPVIGLAYGLAAYGLMKVPNSWVRWGTLVITLLLFLYGGPLRFILYNQSVFADWFR